MAQGKNIFSKGDRVRNRGLLTGFIHDRIDDGMEGTVVEKDGDIGYEANGGDFFVWVDFDDDDVRTTSVPARDLEHVDD